MADRTASEKTVAMNRGGKKTSNNILSRYISNEILITIVIAVVVGWSLYEKAFGASVSFPIGQGFSFAGWKAFVAYMVIAFVLYALADMAGIDTSKYLVIWGYSYGPLAIAVFLRTGFNRTAINILLFMVGANSLYALSRIKKKVSSFTTRVRKVKKKALIEWSKTEFVRQIMTGFYQWLGILFVCMMLGMFFSVIKVDMLQEFNIYELRKDVADGCALSDCDWEEMTRTDIVRKNMGLIRCFSDENWEKLTAEEKVDYISQLCRVECEYLGIKNVPGVHLYTRPNNTKVAGYYRSSDNSIWIGDDQLNEVHWALTVITHETRHCYQHLLMDSLDFETIPEELLELEVYRDVLIWKEESMVDVSPDDGLGLEYKRQASEADAREYSSYAALYYYELANAGDPAAEEEILQRGRVK